MTLKGTCRLCLTPAELQDSHLLPKALYKLLKNAAASDGQKNPNPVVVNKKIALKTSAQVSDHLLCKQCEARFSTDGEKWMLENCWHSDSDFPLRSTLESETPVYVGHSGLSIYEGATISGVNIAKIVYFAASVFWRASAHKWGPILARRPPYGRRWVIRRKQKKELRLEDACILELVDEDVREALLPFAPHCCIVAHEIACAKDEVREIEHTALRLERLIVVDGFHEFALEVRREFGVRLITKQLQCDAKARVLLVHGLPWNARGELRSPTAQRVVEEV